MIDEKGRLFGKLNIVDLLVILVVLIAVVVLGVKFLGGREGSAVNPTTTPVTYTVLVTGVRPEVYESIQEYIPGQLMASGEMLDGYVTAVTAVEHEEQITVSTTGNAVVFPLNQGLLDLTFTVECNVVNPVTTEIGTQEVRVGKSHILKTDRFEVVGLITDCTWGDGNAA